MEGRCAGVETSPSPFSSAACNVLSSVDVNMTLLRVVFGSVFNKSFSLPTTGSQSMNHLGE